MDAGKSNIAKERHHFQSTNPQNATLANLQKFTIIGDALTSLPQCLTRHRVEDDIDTLTLRYARDALRKVEILRV